MTSMNSAYGVKPVFSWGKRFILGIRWYLEIWQKGLSTAIAVQNQPLLSTHRA
jgi:hypothetical protein